MTLIVIVTCLALELFAPYFTAWRRYDWMQAYGQRLHDLAAGLPAWSGPLGVTLVLAPVLLLAGLLQTWLHGVFLNLFLLLYGIVVLGLCLRYDPMEKQLDAVTEALEAGDRDQARRLLADLEVPVDDVQGDVVRQAVDAILTQPAERLFSVLFWFVVLGPLGAVLYRMSWLLHRHPAPGWTGDTAFLQAARRLQAILDWLPVRLLAVGYALTGHFEEAVHEWRDHEMNSVEDMARNNLDILRYAGYGAMHIDRFETEHDSEGQPLCLEVDAVRAAHGLVLRSILAWGIVLALMTLAGWAAW